MRKCAYCDEEIQAPASVCDDCKNMVQASMAEAQKNSRTVLVVGGLFAVIMALVIGSYGCSGGGSSSITGTGTWMPVDSAHGYALVTLTNSGSSDVVAKCTVKASTDFGDMGWDYMTGENVPAGQTISAKFPLTIQNNAAMSVTSVEVTDC